MPEQQRSHSYAKGKSHGVSVSHGSSDGGNWTETKSVTESEAIGSESSGHTAVVSVSIAHSDTGVEAYVSGADYRDVLQKIEKLRVMALEGLRREEER